MQEIYCSIGNCHYWDQGNMCKAKEIIVTSDLYASQTPDNIDAPKHQSFPKMNAATCMETCCKTFVEKGSNNVGIDGVKRT